MLCIILSKKEQLFVLPWTAGAWHETSRRRGAKPGVVAKLESPKLKKSPGQRSHGSTAGGTAPRDALYGPVVAGKVARDNGIAKGGGCF
jgi:hypothetical protein